MNQHGWGRRNLWGILALVPAAAAFLAVHLENTPVGTPKAVTVAQDGWASYAGGRVRLLEVAPAKDVRDTKGGFLKLPDGIAAWRAVVEYDTEDQAALKDCRLSLEDSQGRLFTPKPFELSGAQIPATGCTAEDATLRRYQTFVFFVTPAGAEPVAVRLTVTGEDYARLTRP